MMKFRMKNTIVLLAVVLSFSLQGQNRWFSVYNDSIAMVKDAELISQKFSGKIKNANPTIKTEHWKIIRNTTPYLIYLDINKKTVNLPFWQEVIPEQKEFFRKVSGGELQGKEVFGLFFNGFYLVHELGHGLAESTGKKFDNAFDSEYDANTIAVLYWRTTKHKNSLKKCYRYAKKMISQLTNPVPANEDYKKYITDHYEEITSDPYQYGYIQFSQFVEIYQKTKNINFETFIKNYKK